MQLFFQILRTQIAFSEQYRSKLEESWIKFDHEFNFTLRCWSAPKKAFSLEAVNMTIL